MRRILAILTLFGLFALAQAMDIAPVSAENNGPTNGWGSDWGGN